MGKEQCDQKKSPNVFKYCPKTISLEKWTILTPLQKLPKNVGDLGKLIVAKGFKKLPKVQKIAQSGHTGKDWLNIPQCSSKLMHKIMLCSVGTYISHVWTY